MEITITGRNLDLDKSLKQYIHKRFDKLDRVYRRVIKCEIILEEEKIRQNAEAILHLKRTKIVARESSPDMYASIDSAYDKIKKQLRRLNGRLSSKRRKVMFDRFMGPMTRFRKTEEDDYSDQDMMGE